MELKVFDCRWNFKRHIIKVHSVYFSERYLVRDLEARVLISETIFLLLEDAACINPPQTMDNFRNLMH